jgi:hypothetical protein
LYILKIRFMQTAQVPTCISVCTFRRRHARLCKSLQAKLTRSQGVSRQSQRKLSAL